jgi:hypothetical protein
MLLFLIVDNAKIMAYIWPFCDEEVPQHPIPFILFGHEVDLKQVTLIDVQMNGMTK